MHKQRRLLLTAVIVGIIATAFPWASQASGMFGFTTSTRLSAFMFSTGHWYFANILAAGVIAVWRDRTKELDRKMRRASFIVSVLAFVSLLLFYFDMRAADFEVTIGLLLAFAAPIMISYIALTFKSPTYNLSDDMDQLGDMVGTVLKGEYLGTIKDKVGDMLGKEKKPDRMEELEKLIAWRNEGKITSEEYEELKSKLL